MPQLPNSFDDFKKNAKLNAALMLHMKKGHTLENFKFYFDKGNAAGIYPKYLGPNAKEEVNIQGKLIRAARALGEAGDFDNAMWPKIIEQAKKEVNQLCKSDVFPRFYASEEYKNYCKKEKMGDPKKAAKILGISNLKLLTSAMEEAAVGNREEAEKHLTKLLKEEKMKEKAAVILKQLEKAGLC